MAVTDRLGSLRGYASRLEWNDPTQHTAASDPGTPVYDGSATLEGYFATVFIHGSGTHQGYFLSVFIDLRTARDPALVAKVKAHGDMILDASGKLVSAQVWMQRVKDGTAKVR